MCKLFLIKSKYVLHLGVFKAYSLMPLIFHILAFEMSLSGMLCLYPIMTLAGFKLLSQFQSFKQVCFEHFSLPVFLLPLSQLFWTVLQAE